MDLDATMVFGDRLLSQPLIADRYELYSEIGRGGFGIVYQAFDVRLMRLVAIKLPHTAPFNARAHERFEREVRTAARVLHPNVCRVLDAGVLPDRRPFAVLEHLVGQSLHMMGKRGFRWSPEQTIAIVLDLLSGLEAIHALGILHRDVKPANVFLVERPEMPTPFVKLLDFGSSRDDEERMTSGRHCVGTPSYMPPEQLGGDRGGGPAVDLYAVGAVMYEMLTGGLAYEGDIREVVTAILLHPFPRLLARRPDLPRSLDAIVARATARRVSDRYQRVAELARDLLEARAELEDEPPTLVRRR